MRLIKYQEVLETLNMLIAGTKFEGHLYSVGGCERDRLCGRDIKDIDLVLDIPNGGIEFATWLYENGRLTGEPVVYEHFGTAMFHLKSIPDVELEAVQTRKECYRDIESRNPETAFGTIEDDCTRRDFTYNAIYFNISKKEVCDFNGRSLEDLKNNILRTCGEPDVIFTEDPLRLLRAIRFACRFGSTIDSDTYNGMCKHAKRLEIISRERVQKELEGILTSDNPGMGIKLISDIGAMDIVFPHFGKDSTAYALVAKRNLEVIGSKDFCINLALVLRHSEDYLQDLLSLKCSNDVIDEIKFLRQSFTVCPNDLTPYYLRKFQHFCKTYDKFVNACIYLRSEIGDRASEFMEKTIGMMADGTDLINTPLPVDGEFVMKVKNIPPSKEVKKYLDLLQEAMYINPFLNEEDCLQILKAN